MKIRFLMLAMVLPLMFLACSDDSEDNEIKELEKATVFSYNTNAQAIYLDGVINSKAFDDFTAIAEKNPDTKWIHIVNCDGSINDDVNLKLSDYVHKNGFHTRLLKDGMVASGGTDFFLSGNYRIMESNVKLGVHSWSDGKQVATDFPKDHKYHQPYINYYISIGMTKDLAEDFYFFTINSATADGIHWMTQSELEKYNFENKPPQDLTKSQI
ncbi:alpha/beta hydrolase [Puteibacter caeruleilacunae]|nr:alpha/beta hydrolase [Puteibacter caeruleilacunae]